MFLQIEIFGNRTQRNFINIILTIPQDLIFLFK